VAAAGGGRRSSAPPQTLRLLRSITSTGLTGFDGVVWTYNMRRMAVLVEQALRYAEPVLLVGETGCVDVFPFVVVGSVSLSTVVVVYSRGNGQLVRC